MNLMRTEPSSFLQRCKSYDQQCREHDCDSIMQREDFVKRHISTEFSEYSTWAYTEFSTQAKIKSAKEVTQREEAPGKWLYKDRSKETKGEQGGSTDDFVREVKR